MKIYAAFCGTGKSHLCKKYPQRFKEIECWQYRNKENFPQNYTDEVNSQTVENLLISTDPAILKNLNKKVTLIYPHNSLREEYLDRYIERDSPYDFIGTVMKNWHTWLDELKPLDMHEHIVLQRGQYLGDVIGWGEPFSLTPNSHTIYKNF